MTMFARNLLRIGAACVLVGILSWAQPSLTTISDTVFKADGTRFNGLVQITWVTFESGNGSNISQQTTTVRIIDGNLFVRLTPTTNAVPQSVYAVRYSSDGLIQFQETWAVPPSTVSLRVRDVRTTSPVFPGGIGAVTQIQESDVIGLTPDLGVRVVKGPGYTNSRTAVINDSGQLEGAVGSPGDCVKVDGTSGTCGSGGGSSVTFVDKEVPGGAIDGANLFFSVANTPSPASSLHLFRNGLLQRPGFDYILSGSTITFVSAAGPLVGDSLLASYRR